MFVAHHRSSKLLIITKTTSVGTGRMLGVPFHMRLGGGGGESNVVDRGGDLFRSQPWLGSFASARPPIDLAGLSRFYIFIGTFNHKQRNLPQRSTNYITMICNRFNLLEVSLDSCDTVIIRYLGPAQGDIS